jgi:hypothetical protein
MQALIELDLAAMARKNIGDPNRRAKGERATD